MAKARQIVKRRRAVRNIRKITQTMQLIATARYQKTYQRALASKPFTRHLTEMLQTISGAAGTEHPLLRASANHDRSLLLVITSNRGLAGSYNAAVLRRMIEFRGELRALGLEPEMEVVGKKGVNYLKFLRVPVASAITDVEDKIEYARVSAMAERYMARFLAGALARVDVVYMQFQSVGVQRPTTLQLLPIEPPAAEAQAPGTHRVRPQFEFSPEPAVLLGRLVPEAVKVRLQQCFNDAIVSEQVARMVAMKAATDAGSEMLKFLTRQYNRARQSQITTELADIVGGANAVQ